MDITDIISISRKPMGTIENIYPKVQHEDSMLDEYMSSFLGAEARVRSEIDEVSCDLDELTFLLKYESLYTSWTNIIYMALDSLGHHISMQLMRRAPHFRFGIMINSLLEFMVDFKVSNITDYVQKELMSNDNFEVLYVCILYLKNNEIALSHASLQRLKNIDAKIYDEDGHTIYLYNM
ncbi:hypothetical protein GCM10010844_39880 [Deinococcus radiotolerans]|uniref:Uncharacterized protein n=2 Tax=Deinococcus radiotolerans TaxID=1309407 RepID=A0ABQ2FQI4_9DEIO|nr:hypothetical protein GCM10010844_39880 [Deinococcus radiotolerans]